jgi:katanin p80 WD40 repeat-containing subunit B1
VIYVASVIKFSPDGRWVASGGDDGLVKIWDLTAGKQQAARTCYCHDLHPDSPAGKQLAEFRHDGPVCSIDYHPSEFLLLSGSKDRRARVWDLDSFALLRSALALSLSLSSFTDFYSARLPLRQRLPPL